MEPRPRRSYWKAVGVAVLAVGAVGFLANLVLTQACKGQYQFVDAQHACGTSPGAPTYVHEAMGQEMRAYIQGKEASGEAEEIAVYFKDLVAGTVIGIDELNDFAPASLLKLPLAIAYLSEAEKNPALLQEELAYFTLQQVAEPAFPSNVGFIQGQRYTVERLLEGMIANSDNGAYQTLLKRLADKSGGVEMVIQVSKELGVVTPSGVDEILSVRSYGTIFRTLYNSAYLSPKSSEKLLGWLAGSTFADGLRAGVPEGVAVAHKFGEREYFIDGKLMTAKQLHDCGIVYHPGRPYILCVMTKGGDLERLKSVLKDISAIAYKHVDSD